MRGLIDTAAIGMTWALAMTLVAGCGGPVGRRMHQEAPAPAGSTYGEAEVRFGRIERIDAVKLDGDHQLGVGHVLGAVGGGALGHQFGGGKGKAVARVLGTLGGGYVGGEVQSKYADARPGQVITVSLGNGVAVGITQPANAALRVGDCVRIDGSGQAARVVPADCAGLPPPDARPTGEQVAAAFGPQGEMARSRIQARMRQPPAAGTAATGAPSGDAAIRQGRVESIEAVSISDAENLGLHQVSNGVVGGAMGYQLPGGGSREFADVARVLGGDATPPTQRPFTSPQPGQYILVRLDNGVVVGISQFPDAALRIGDRVRIDGAGSGARVVRV